MIIIIIHGHDGGDDGNSNDGKDVHEIISDSDS